MASTRYGVNFNGRRIVHPGAYDKIDASAMTVVTEGSSNLPIVVGTATSGKSGEVHWFSDAQEAKEYLVSGDLVNAIEMMFSPTPEGGGGASTVGVIVANSTTQATHTAGLLTFKSLTYGGVGNRIQVKLEGNATGDIAGTKRLTVYRWDTDVQEIYTNLGAVVSLKYTGTVVGDATASITASGNSKKLTTTIGDQTDLDIDLGNERFRSINDLVIYLNSLSNYEAAFVGYMNATMDSIELDVTTSAVDIKTGGYLMSEVGDILQQVNSYSELIEVTKASSGTLSTFDYTYLSGGGSGDVPASWADLFNVTKTEYSDILVVLSPTESIHAEALIHISQMEQRNQKQMLFTGGAIAELPARVKQRASVLNSSRAVLAYPGIYHKAVGGGKTLLAPYFTAALIAGRVCGVDASEPITFDYFSLVGLEKNLVAGDPEIDDLITSGVCVLEKVQNGGIRLVQGITTYLSDNNTLYREISVRRGADRLSSTMQQAMETTFVGKKFVGAVTSTAITTRAIDILEQAIKDELIVAYRNIQVRFTGTTVYVDYEVAPVSPINYILITSRFVPEIENTVTQ